MRDQAEAAEVVPSSSTVGRGTATGHRRTKTHATRLQLIRSAERLFAERGIEAVPLRDIHTAARQRNTSAINYHFGGKEELVQAVIEHRARATNARRAELLAAADCAGRGHDVRTLVNVLVRPLADQIVAGTHYAGLLARVIAERGLDRPVRLNSDPVWSNTSLVEQRLRTALPDLDRGVVTMRFQLVLDLAIHALATYQGATHLDPACLPPLDVYLARLLDAMTGLLTAPDDDGRSSGSVRPRVSQAGGPGNHSAAPPAEPPPSACSAIPKGPKPRCALH